MQQAYPEWRHQSAALQAAVASLLPASRAFALPQVSHHPIEPFQPHLLALVCPAAIQACGPRPRAFDPPPLAHRASPPAVPPHFSKCTMRPSTNANRLSTYYIGILHELIVSGKGRSVSVCFPGRARTPTSMSGPGVPGRQAGVRLPERPGVRPPLPSAPGVAPAAGVAPP